MSGVLKIGTRGSPLALRQAEEVMKLLRKKGVECRLRVVAGDPRGESDTSVQSAGKERFVKSLRRSLLEGEVDVAVHSLKDVPLPSCPGIILAAFPAEEDPRDAFVSYRFSCLEDMPPGGLVGTSSPRRVLQLRLLRPDLRSRPLYGNLETRLRKLREGEFDAVILALAGLRRLGLEEMVKEVFPVDLFVPAPGQGIIALETREEDLQIRELLEAIDDIGARARAIAERAFCAAVGADCYSATGVVALQRDGLLEMEALHLLESSGEVMRGRIKGSAARPEEVGTALAYKMYGDPQMKKTVREDERKPDG